MEGIVREICRRIDEVIQDIRRLFQVCVDLVARLLQRGVAAPAVDYLFTGLLPLRVREQSLLIVPLQQVLLVDEPHLHCCVEEPVEPEDEPAAPAPAAEIASGLVHDGAHSPVRVQIVGELAQGQTHGLMVQLHVPRQLRALLHDVDGREAAIAGRARRQVPQLDDNVVAMGLVESIPLAEKYAQQAVPGRVDLVGVGILLDYLRDQVNTLLICVFGVGQVRRQTLELLSGLLLGLPYLGEKVAQLVDLLVDVGDLLVRHLNGRRELDQPVLHADQLGLGSLLLAGWQARYDLLQLGRYRIEGGLLLGQERPGRSEELGLGVDQRPLLRHVLP